MEDRWELSAEQSPGFGPIAERFRRAGELDRAVALCREGLSKFPNHLSGRVTLGWALLDLGRYGEARVELERVIKRAPDNLAAIRGLAELHDREEHPDFVPAEAPHAWPPKPDAAGAPVPAANAAWRDPDEFVTESPGPTPPVAGAEHGSVVDVLPALMAELDPLLAVPEAKADSTETPLVTLDSSAPDSLADAPAFEPLQAVMAELNAATPLPNEDTSVTVADLAATDPADLDEALLALTRTTEASGSSPLTLDAAPPVELSAPATFEADLLPHFEESALEAPAMDILADLGLPDADAFGDVEVEPAAIAADDTLELALNESVDPLLEAAAAVEVMALPADEPVSVAEAKSLPVPTVELAADDLPLRVTAETAEPDVDVPLDPAVFELAREASTDHATPNVELLRDEVFDPDPESHVEMTALTMELAARDFPAPEPAAAPLASAAEAAHDLQIDIPTLTAQSDHPSRELLESMIVPAGLKASEASESQLEQAFNVSQAFASALDGRAEFASPQIPQIEPGEAEAPVLLAPLLPPIADSHWSEPEQPSPEAHVPDPPVVPEPPPVAPEPVVAAPRTPPKRPIAGLQRFLRRVEGRKAKLASHSAA